MKIIKDKQKLKNKWKKFKISFRKKIYLNISKIKYILYHENTRILKTNIVVWMIRLVGMGLFALFILLALRLIGYNITIMNFISSFALLMLIEEIPAFIKRCRK